MRVSGPEPVTLGAGDGGEKGRQVCFFILILKPYSGLETWEMKEPGRNDLETLQTKFKGMEVLQVHGALGQSF